MKLLSNNGSFMHKARRCNWHMQSIKSECSKLKCVNSEFNQSGNSLITSACSLEINL